MTEVNPERPPAWSRRWNEPMMATLITSTTAAATTTKVRLRFAKSGDLRLVSHHDLMRCLERMLRRAGLPVAYTQGFNPRPKVTFALALALGIEGCREVLDLEFDEPMEPSEVLRRLAAEAPPGFDFLEAEATGPGRAARVVAASYRLLIPKDHRDRACAAVADLLSRESLPYTRHRPDRTVELDLRPFVLGARLAADGVLELRMKIAPEGSARPEEVIDALGLKDLVAEGAVLVRADVELHTPDGGQDPPAPGSNLNSSR